MNPPVPRTKRGRPDYRRAPTTEELRSLTSFSYKEHEAGLRITFSKTHSTDPTRVTAWNATVSRSTDGTSKSVCVYAGTDRTLPKNFAKTVSKIKKKAVQLGRRDHPGKPRYIHHKLYLAPELQT